MDLLSQFNQLRAYSYDPSIRPPPWLSIQEQAVHICFKNFDSIFGSYDAQNLLLALAPLYQASLEGSPLRHATQAAALAVVSQLPGKRNLQHEAARSYGRAMTAMAMALADSQHAQTNDTLLSALLLSWFEAINASEGSMNAWSKHIEGATQMVMLRGTTQFRDPLGLSLFREIRIEMFIDCLRLEREPVEFPEVGWWSSDTYHGTYDHRDSAAELMHYAMDLPALRKKQKDIMHQGLDPVTAAAMSCLVDKALELEKKISECNLPDEMRPRTVAYVPELREDFETAEAWLGPIHGYTSIYDAGTLNKLRVIRALMAKLVINGLTWAYPEDYFLQKRYLHAKYVEQHAIDDICSSVPSHFDWAKRVSLDHEEIRHISNLIAGYLLHWPLRVARNSPRISRDQRTWIDRQLKDIAERCGVHQATMTH